MKKRMWICSFVLTMCLFHLSISNFVFGQEPRSPAQQVFDSYPDLLQRADIQELFPGFLRIFKRADLQSALDPTFIEIILNNPLSYQNLDEKIDNQFLLLLSTDDELRKLFREPQFYTVFKDPEKIEEFARLIEAQRTKRPGDLTIVSGDLQEGDPRTTLGNPLVVLVQDQYGDALSNVNVNFHVTKGGRLSSTAALTSSAGQAQTIFTLGSEPGIYQVKASVADYPSLTQTFTAAVTTTATTTTICPTVPVVPEPPSTSEPSLPPMYWIEGNTIYYRPTGGEKTPLRTPEGGTLTGGLAVDTVGGKVYWTEKKSWTETGRTGEGQIQSANLDGSTIQTIKKITAVPWDIALGAGKKNAEDRRLYWTNSSGRIQHIKVSGGRVETLFELNRPKHIAFDTEKERLHWTDADGIWSTAPEGSKPMKWPSHLPDDLGDDLDKVRGIAVFDDVVYWTEQTSNGGKVRAMNRKGLGDKKLLAGLEEIIPGGIAVDAVGQKVYWTTSRGEVQSALTDAQTVTIRGGVPTGIALGGTVAPATSGALMAPSISPVVSVENTLLANYPNPFNPETWIPYQLSASADVSISIYSVNGHLVRRLDLGHQSAGVYQSRSRAAYWDGRNEFGERVASGLYFYTLTAGDFTATRKMLIRK